MINSKDLHTLIRSLSNSEKKYYNEKTLKLNPKGTKYFDLFLVLNSIKIFSKTKFENKCKNKNLTNLSYLQNYLFSSLIDEMMNYNKNFDPKILLNQYKIQSKFLYNRGLKKESYNILIKSFKLAEKNQYYNQLLEIIDGIIIRLQYGKQTKTVKNKIASFIQKRKEFETKQSEYLNSSKLTIECIEFVSTDFRLRSKSHREKTFELLNRINTISKINNFKARNYYLQAKLEVKRAFDEEPNIHSKTLVELYTNHNEFINTNIENYITIILNHIIVSYKKNKLTEVPTHFDELKKLKNICTKRNLGFALDILKLGKLTLEYNKNLNLKDEINLEKNITDLEVNFQSDNNQEVEIANTFIELPFFYFNKKDYSKSLVWITKILNIAISQSHFKKHYLKIKILEIIIHFELGNLYLLKNLTEANLKFIQKYNDYFETEKILFKLFNSKAFQNNEILKLKNKFESTYNELSILFENDKYERIDNQDIKLLDWLKPKI